MAEPRFGRLAREPPILVYKPVALRSAVYKPVASRYATLSRSASSNYKAGMTA